MASSPLPAVPRRLHVPFANSVLFKTITASVVEDLERRYLLTALTGDVAYDFEHLSDAARHAIAVVEYNNPEFQAALDAELAALGLDPIPPQPGTIPGDTGKS